MVRCDMASCGIVWRGIVWFGMIWHDITAYGITWYCIVLHRTVLCGLLLHVLHCMVLYYGYLMSRMMTLFLRYKSDNWKYLTLLYDWYTEVYNNRNRRVQISCVIVHFETRLNQFLKMLSWKMDQIHFVSKYLETKRQKYFQILSYFSVSISMFTQSW